MTYAILHSRLAADNPRRRRLLGLAGGSQPISRTGCRVGEVLSVGLRTAIQ